MGDHTVAIIPCTNQKSDRPGPAREVWVGNHFQLILAHAEMFYDTVYIMSYKYGLIEPDALIEPYDIDLRTANAGTRLRWWAKMKGDIADVSSESPLLVALYTGAVERDRIITEFVRNGVEQVITPFEGLKVGDRMSKVYDLEEPFDRNKALEGGYKLTEDWKAIKSAGNKYLPPMTSLTDTIEWED